MIHAIRDRNYKYGKKIVAKNRRKRLGQKAESLADLIESKGEGIVDRPSSGKEMSSGIKDRIT